MKTKAFLSLTLVAGLGLTACSNPYDPGQRAVGGGLLGAGAGAGLGAIAGGGRGAAIGALAGGALGAAGGAATTPNAPRERYYEQPAPGYYQRPGYGY
jgi:hypothetical protein